MKKVVIAIILVGLVGWAIYEFLDKPEEAKTEEETSEYKEKEDPNISASKEVEDKGPLEGGNESEVLQEEAVVGLEAGNIAPDFELTTLEGETVQLSDYRGQRVMLNFWATWCPPCRAEMPDMQKFHEDKDAVILAVNLTETNNEKENIPDFVEEFGLTFSILLDEQLEVADLYKIQPIPTTFLINSDGVIHNKAFGALNYELMVQEYEMMK